MPIMDNFNYQIFEEVTEENNGLMSAEDKEKLDNINLEDIKTILDFVKENRVEQ